MKSLLKPLFFTAILFAAINASAQTKAKYISSLDFLLSENESQVKIFDDRFFKKNALTLEEGIYDFSSLRKNGISAIRSMHIPEGFAVMVYTGEQFSGRKELYQKSINYIGIPFKSIVVTKI